MSDEILPFDELDMNELSAEDLAVIQAFDAMEVWVPGSSPGQGNEQNEMLATPQACSPQEDGEMLLVFAAEAEADISSIRQILDQLAQDEGGNLTLFLTLKRASHKLHGAAGVVGFPLITAVAGQVELIAEGVSCGTISTDAGIEAISAAATVLEACLQAITSTNEELAASPLLASLEAVYQCLQIDLQQLEQGLSATVKTAAIVETPLPSTSPLHIDTRGSEHLTAHTEQLVASIVEDTRRSVFCCNVRVADQRLLIPFDQIQRVINGQQEQTDICYSLQELLGLSSEASPQSTTEPLAATSQHLLLLRCEGEVLEGRNVGIAVDEVLGEQECTIEPLPAYLQRPGIAGVTIDSEGCVVLVIDLWELLRFKR